MMIIFMILLVSLLILFVIEVILSIKWLFMKRKNSWTLKQSKHIKKISILLVIVTCLTGGLMIFSQLTATTPPIKDENGTIIEGSIAQLEKVKLNGKNEWISIRGESSQNPVLLFLAGGPGGTQMAAVRHHLSELEKYFVVVVWDQPGSGKSYSVGGKYLTPDTYIEDGISLTKYLCKKFNQKKIYLMGESWGSALSVFLASKSPDYYHAVVGTGQMVAFLETEKVDYAKALEIAENNGDKDKIAKLKSNGTPPYYGSDVTWKSAEYLNYLNSYMGKNPNIHNSGFNTFRDILSSEYGIIDKVNFLRGIVTTFNHVYPQLYPVDLRTDYKKLEVPIYFFLGRHDMNAPTSLVEDYEAILEAPHKEIIWFEHSGHSPWINESKKFVDELLSIVNK